MTVLKSEITKSDKKEKEKSMEQVPSNTTHISHEKEHIRTIFLKLMNGLLQG